MKNKANKEFLICPNQLTDINKLRQLLRLIELNMDLANIPAQVLSPIFVKKDLSKIPMFHNFMMRPKHSSFYNVAIFSRLDTKTKTQRQMKAIPK